MNGQCKLRQRPLLAVLLLLTLLVPSQHVDAASVPPTTALSVPDGGAQRRWTLHSDNDLFAFTHKDRDYTGGVSVTLTDTNPTRCARATRRCVEARLPAPIRAVALDLGLLLFTPQDLSAEEPLTDDRPYASLLYAARSKLAHEPAANVAYQSTLTVGLLGLRVAEQVQRRVHATVGAQLPMGYDHQISAGGEGTFRYARSRYRLLAAGGVGSDGYALRLDTTLSVGFLTEADAALTFRWGSRAERWWESLADEGDYAGQPVIAEPPLLRRRHAFALTAGVKLRGRLYNAFLQGQFRHSDVAYRSAETEHVLGEVWLGVDVFLDDRLRLSYVIRRQSKELAVGADAHAFTWAGLTVSRGFG